jgi:hypothetical protein
VWLEDEIAKMRRTQSLSKKTTSKAKPRQRVGHAKIDSDTYGRSDNEPMQIRFYVQPIGERWAAMIVGDESLSPGPDEVRGQGFFGDTACKQRNWRRRSWGCRSR